MTVYSRQIATAHRLIAKKGVSATWRKQNAGVNAGQPWKTTAGVPTDVAVKVVRLPVTDPTEKLVAGTSVTEISEKLLMAGDVPFVPAVNDMVLFGSDSRQVKGIDVLQPDGTPIMYTIFVL